MKAAAARGKHLAIPRHLVAEIEAIAVSTDLSVRRIYERIEGKVSRRIVGEIAKQVRATPPMAL